MARGDILQARLLARITEGGLELTVHYPPDRPAATGTSPGTAPISPLTGPRPAQQVFPAATTPSKPALTVPCLWYPSVALLPRSMIVNPASVGWMAEADGFAQVKVSDCALDPADPYGDTVFTAAEVVEHSGHRFRVLLVQPVSAGHRVPVTYYVWLAGAAKQ